MVARLTLEAGLMGVRLMVARLMVARLILEAGLMVVRLTGSAHRLCQ